MNINDREHYELMMQFEKSFPGNCYDREPKKLWQKGIIYENGKVNELFIVYRMGYAHRTCIANLEECEENMDIKEGMKLVKRLLIDSVNNQKKSIELLDKNIEEINKQLEKWKIGEEK